MALRAIPQLTDFRPADANETAACWKLALERKSASFMALTRQDLPVLDAAKYKVLEGCAKGAYVLEAYGKDVVIVATGSEVSTALKAAEELKGAGILRDRRLDAELQDLRRADRRVQDVDLPAWRAEDFDRSGRDDGLVEVRRPRRRGRSGWTALALRRRGRLRWRSWASAWRNVVEHAKKLVKK